MYEYSSVSASSYDPAALVAKLNEAAADGWDVVSIVPTGGDVSAFLRRDAAAAEDGLVEEAVLDEAVLDEGIFGEAVAEEEAAEEPVIEEVVVDSWSTGDTAAADTGAAGLEGSDTAVDEVEVIEVSEVVPETPVEEAPVDEPAGWAVAPDTSTTTTDAAADEIPVVATGSAVEEVAEPAAVPAAEPTPVPAPVPEPAPVVTTPAGWYPDPSTRYELRYWDGTQWTEHVARQGQQFTDPPVR